MFFAHMPSPHAKFAEKAMTPVVLFSQRDGNDTKYASCPNFGMYETSSKGPASVGASSTYVSYVRVPCTLPR